MHAIYKTLIDPLPHTPEGLLACVLRLPIGARPLSVGIQGGRTGEPVPALWWLVDPALDVVDYVVALALTGQDLPTTAKDWHPIGRVEIGPYVLHAFYQPTLGQPW